MADFQVKLKNNTVKRKWHSLCVELPEPMERLTKYLEENPQDRSRSNGKLKKLKGKLEGILQYDLTNRHRVHYRVDVSERIVYVEYIGLHP
jgi:mRNA-degrading endonuclease RelE of RelBE toxin-antitoxin system